MIRLGTRGSALALRQSGFVADALRAAGAAVGLIEIATRGDASDRPFRELEGQAFFTRELDEALLAGAIDVAVHSLKDLPTGEPAGLATLCVLPRADPRDVLLARRGVLRAAGPGEPIERRPADGARVGTSSARRFAQLLAQWPALEVGDLRGNVPTRVAKLRRGEFDAIVLAAAGLERLRLDLSDLEVVALPAPAFLPAPGQGVLACRLRAGDEAMRAALLPLRDGDAECCAAIERELLARLDGGCSLPLGAWARRCGEAFELDACLAGASGMRRTAVRAAQPRDAARAALACLRGEPLAVITRPESSEQELAAALRAADLPFLIQPAIEFVELPPSAERGELLRDAAAHDCVALTSRRAVESLVHHAAAAGLAPDALRALRLAAVGPATAAALAGHGLAPWLVADGSGGGALAERLARALPRGGRVLHPGPIEPEGTLAQRLAERGIATTLLPLYATRARGDDPALPDAPLAFAVASPSAARALLARAGVAARMRAAPAALRFVAGGATTAAELVRLGIADPIVARLPTGAPLAEALAAALHALRGPDRVADPARARVSDQELP